MAMVEMSAEPPGPGLSTLSAMVATEPTTAPDPDLTAAEVAWDLEPLLTGAPGVEDATGTGPERVAALLAEAERRAEGLADHRGRVAALDAAGLAGAMRELATVQELIERAGSYASLWFSTNTADAERGALLQRVREQGTAITTRLLFFELEWAAVDDERAEALLTADELAFCRHHLRRVRARRPHLLSEPEERILSEKEVTGRSAWARLFSELTSAIEVDVDGDRQPLMTALSRLSAPERDVRRRAAEAVTEALRPGLRTRAFIFNTLLADKATDDRLRSFPHWLASRNLDNEASDESVEALVAAVRARYDVPQRWYRLKARLLGLDRLADYDRAASLETDDRQVGWAEATRIVVDSYASFSDELAGVVRRFIDEGWVDAPARPAKRGGAFCAYTVPSVHPFVLLNWTSRMDDVLTLAHELGHGVHAYLARDQGIFHHSTPLTLAETASVFGETVTFNRLLAATDDPNARLALLAEQLEGGIATVFRQTAMNRFEHLAHTARREQGELSVEQLGELWAQTQAELFGDAVEVTEGYRSWWSYIPHFIDVPGYVYAYAYGQLLALSVYRRYEQRGAGFVPQYLELLRAGGSAPPEELAAIVDCDLADPGFWDGGIDIIEAQLAAAEQAARDAGRLGA